MYKNWCLNTKHQEFRKIKILNTCIVTSKYSNYLNTQYHWLGLTSQCQCKYSFSSHSMNNIIEKQVPSLPHHLEINTILIYACTFYFTNVANFRSPYKKSCEPLSRL